MHPQLSSSNCSIPRLAAVRLRLRIFTMLYAVKAIVIIRNKRLRGLVKKILQEPSDITRDLFRLLSAKGPRMSPRMNGAPGISNFPNRYMITPHANMMYISKALL